jgi:hypothetical protein
MAYESRGQRPSATDGTDKRWRVRAAAQRPDAVKKRVEFVSSHAQFTWLAMVVIKTPKARDGDDQ